MSILRALKTRLQPVLLLFLLLSTSAAQAQGSKKIKVKAPANADGSPSAPAPARPVRLQPLFGGLPPAEAVKLFGTAKLDAIAASFASRPEASAFFATKGFEYLSENQTDTAAYRFNLAWLLNPQNADAYRGLGIVSSTQASPDATIALLNQGIALAPTNPLLLSDLGTTLLVRYERSKKKKDLTKGMELLQQATAADPANAVAWQQLARGYYYQEKYPQAWEAVHKGRALDMTSMDFTLISELQAKQPDPQGMFK